MGKVRQPLKEERTLVTSLNCEYIMQINKPILLLCCNNPINMFIFCCQSKNKNLEVLQLKIKKIHKTAEKLY